MQQLLRPALAMPCTAPQCQNIYKPGDDACSCFSCSAFTDKRSCQNRDLTVGWYGCCFTCPPQPVCAQCVTPCNPTFIKIEVIPGELPSTPESYNTLSYSYTSEQSATNLGNNPQTITVTFSFSQQLTSTMQYAEAFQYSEKATLKVCIMD